MDQEPSAGLGDAHAAHPRSEPTGRAVHPDDERVGALLQQSREQRARARAQRDRANAQRRDARAEHLRSIAAMRSARHALFAGKGEPTAMWSGEPPDPHHVNDHSAVPANPVALVADVAVRSLHAISLSVTRILQMELPSAACERIDRQIAEADAAITEVRQVAFAAARLHLVDSSVRVAAVADLAVRSLFAIGLDVASLLNMHLPRAARELIAQQIAEADAAISEVRQVAFPFTARARRPMDLSASLSTGGEPRAFHAEVLARFFGELDLVSADEATSCLIESPATVVIADLSDVSFIDAAGISALLRAHDYLAAAGHRLELRGARPRVRRLFEVVGLGALLEEALDVAG